MARLMKDGKELKTGDVVTDFRGEEMLVAGFSLPRHSGSTGRIDLKAKDGVYLGQFFPSVVDAYIELTKAEKEKLGY